MTEDCFGRILVTGANGFLGSRLAGYLREREKSVTCVTRSKIASDCEVENIVIPSFKQDRMWRDALDGVKTVIHCAARVHAMNDIKYDPLDVFREVNTLGTLDLARQAAEAGVKRFIFISSIKVNGESTQANCPFTAFDKRFPKDAYGKSKSEAEERLLALAKETRMDVVIIRPPLVYGPGVKANFASLMNLAGKNFPLPFGATNNKRSLVAIDNLVDLIVICIDHPKAANQVFLASDDYDVSTTELLEELTRAAGREPRLISLPIGLMEVCLALIGKKAMADRLFGNLQLDISHTKDTLGWKPPVSFAEGVALCFEKKKS